VLLTTHADLFQDPHGGQVVREAASGDSSNPQPVERVRHHRGDSLGRVAVAAVRRVEDIAEVRLRPWRHAGLTHAVDQVERYGPDHHAVEGHRRAVVVGVLSRVPPGRPEGHRVDLGAQQPPGDLGQVAVLQDPVDVRVAHRAKLEAFGADCGAPHEARR
jgi:hypothetical protein